VGDELRDRNGLGSALARPQQAAHYAQADLAAQAATLLWGIAETQAFVDGNKRIALVVTLTFLGLNGYAVQLSEDERVQLMFDIADGMTVDEVAAVLRPRLAATSFDDLEDGLE